MANHLIPAASINSYTVAPSPTKVAAAKSLHENIRSVLGSGYETFLQGSYKNDTGMADINDVDIVALRKETRSGTFSGVYFDEKIAWQEIFRQVQVALEATREYRGKTEPGDKCITVNTDFKADIVPAVKIDVAGDDPIAVYSFREGSERKNYPRVHYQRNVEKQARTADNYKSTVRMFKRWAKNWFKGTKVAPSFDVECLIYNVPDHLFLFDDGAERFFVVGDHITKNISRYTVVNSVAGDKDILVNSEWHPDNYEKFRQTLEWAVIQVTVALRATTTDSARASWRKAFNE